MISSYFCLLVQKSSYLFFYSVSIFFILTEQLSASWLFPENSPTPFPLQFFQDKLSDIDWKSAHIEGPGSSSCRGLVRFHSFFCMIQFGSIHVRIRYFCFGRPTLP